MEANIIKVKFKMREVMLPTQECGILRSYPEESHMIWEVSHV